MSLDIILRKPLNVAYHQLHQRLHQLLVRTSEESKMCGVIEQNCWDDKVRRRRWRILTGWAAPWCMRWTKIVRHPSDVPSPTRRYGENQSHAPFSFSGKANSRQRRTCLLHGSAMYLTIRFLLEYVQSRRCSWFARFYLFGCHDSVLCCDVKTRSSLQFLFFM